MKILMLSCMFMPEVYGGAEKQCLRQSKALKSIGHDVTILTAKTQANTALSEEIEGIRVIRHNTIHQPDLLGRWSLFSLFWALQVLLFALKNKGKFDVVHCHQGKFGLVMGALLAHVWHVPLFVKIGNSERDLDIIALQNKKIIGKPLLNYALKRKPIFIAISTVIAKNLSDFGIPKKQIKVITNGVMPQQKPFKPLDDKNIQLFWHGRFEAIKNLPLLLESFAESLKTHPHLTLNLIGSGSDESLLKNRAEEMGLAHKIHFIKPPQDQDIFESISSFDIFVNSSKAEGMSNSMLEAMALGKMMISTPVSGTHEIIDTGKNGYIAENHTKEALSKAICKGIHLAQQSGMWKNTYNYNIHKTSHVFDMASIATEVEKLYKARSSLK